MKPCWTDGDLRAYTDRELPLEVQERIGEHLDACADCSARYAELSQRAARVADFMAMLPEAAPAGAVPCAPAPARHRRRWAAAALALAAALAIAFVMLPKRSTPRAPVAPAPAVVATATAAPPVVAMPVAQAHPVQRRAAQPKPVERADYFLRLDDEPIETGTLVRVGAENGDVQADLILGPDGRAHAIRVINNQ